MPKEEHRSAAECLERAFRDLHEVALNEQHPKGPWMAAFWKIENGNVFLYRTTCQYPSQDLMAALDLLKANLQEDINQKISDQPLPLAHHIINELTKREEENVQVVVPADSAEGSVSAAEGSVSGEPEDQSTNEGQNQVGG